MTALRCFRDAPRDSSVASASAPADCKTSASAAAPFISSKTVCRGTNAQRTASFASCSLPGTAVCSLPAHSLSRSAFLPRFVASFLLSPSTFPSCVRCRSKQQPHTHRITRTLLCCALLYCDGVRGVRCDVALWCGVVWCGVVWCGVVWCGVVWCDMVWCGVVWRGVTGPVQQPRDRGGAELGRGPQERLHGRHRLPAASAPPQPGRCSAALQRVPLVRR